MSSITYDKSVLTSLNGDNFDFICIFHTNGKVTIIWSDAGTIGPGSYKIQVNEIQALNDSSENKQREAAGKYFIAGSRVR